jgi:hypothetical protein
VEEPAQLALPVPPHHECRVVTVQPEQAVEFHREPPPGLALQPGVLDRGQFGPERGCHVTGQHDLGAESLPFQPVHSLPDRPHWAPVQAELAGADDRLVAVVDRVQPQLPVGGEQPVRRAHDSGAPAAGLRVGQEAPQGQPLASGRPDRVTADQGDAADHPVGDEGLPGDEPFLVRPQGEGRQRVAAPPAHDVCRLLAVPRIREQALPPGANPDGGRPDHADRDDRHHREREPVGDLARQEVGFRW